MPVEAPVITMKGDAVLLVDHVSTSRAAQMGQRATRIQSRIIGGESRRWEGDAPISKMSRVADGV